MHEGNKTLIQDYSNGMLRSKMTVLYQDGFCDDGNKFSGAINYNEFLDQAHAQGLSRISCLTTSFI